MKVSRRAFVSALAAAPLVSLGQTGCRSEPKTPLANLTGERWVHGVYELHARRYLDVQMGAETESHGAYRVLAQKGVSALDGLQAREVPFFMRVDAQTNAFTIERTVPERLTFTADMGDDDRRAATDAWKRAREHIHTDYFEIHRLDWAMTTLLSQLTRIHAAMEAAELEQYKIVRELGELRAGGATRYPLPDKVTRSDYQDVLALLVVRLEEDRKRLAVIEGSIASVGLTARATDAGSGSLAANIHKVMLSVIRDADATEPKAAEFPREPAAKDELLAQGRALIADIEASAEYVKWKRDEENRAIEQVGILFSVFDAVTHLPTSAVFHAVVQIWRGEGDYLAYLKALARLVPGGGQLAGTIEHAITTTEKVRRVARTAQSALRGEKDAVLEALGDKAGGVLNTATQFGRARVEKQLAFFTDRAEIRAVQDALRQTELVTKAMPTVPPPMR